MLVLGPIGCEQQYACRAQALDEAVEQRLRLAVDPVQVLEDQKKWLLTCFPQQQVPYGIQHASPTLSRVERLPCGIVHRHVEQRQQAGSVG